jgi:hypothetical protein
MSDNPEFFDNLAPVCAHGWWIEGIVLYVFLYENICSDLYALMI